MQETAFLKQNFEKWNRTEALINQPGNKTQPDQLADLFIQLTDDLAYAKTFFPNSKSVLYLNGLTARVHQKIYSNRKEKTARIITFWTREVPFAVYHSRKELVLSLAIFIVSALIGIVSAANDSSFVRLILGDSYVNMTLENIDKGDPLAVYKQAREIEMFLGITLNNIYVSFTVFVFGILFSIGTAFILFKNGVMVGAFQYFFHQHDLLIDSMLVIWIHGTLEISAIVLAGAAGLVLGNSFLFPLTHSRSHSFKVGAKRGLKIVVGLIPIFITAGFLEGFVTRHTDMALWQSLSVIIMSSVFVIWYFIIYPYRVFRKG